MIYFIFCFLLGVSISVSNVPTFSLGWWAIIICAIGMAIFSPFTD